MVPFIYIIAVLIARFAAVRNIEDAKCLNKCVTTKEQLVCYLFVCHFIIAWQRLTALHIVLSCASVVRVLNGVRSILYSGLSVCEWVSLCVLKTLWTPCLKKPLRGISPNFGYKCIWVADHILWSKGQKSKLAAKKSTCKIRWNISVQ